MAKKTRNPPRDDSRFVGRDRVRCPACEDRGALRNDGGAKITGGGQLRGSTKDVGVTRASAGCELCAGRGSIFVTDTEKLLAAGFTRAEIRVIGLDPMSLALRPEQAAKLHQARHG